MPSSTYVASRPGSFSALVQAAEIGGFRLDPLLPTHVRDRYFDTVDGRLLRDGLALRVREEDGRRAVGLRAVGGARAPLPPDVDLPAGDDWFELPPGPLAEAVWNRVAPDALRPLLSIRQYRTPRIATRDERSVGLVSFDVVVYEVPGAQVVSNEVDVEYAERDLPDGVLPLDAALREHGLEPVGRTTFERGVLRLPRRLSDPVLLLPDERRRLEEAVEAADTPTQRRALVVLLDAEGYRPDVIATQTGLSLERVRFWKQQFREVRMHVLETDVPERPPVRSGPDSRPSPAESFVPSAPSEGADPRDSGRPYGRVEGDGASSPEPTYGFRDVSELLDVFAPADTSTPLFGEADLTEDLDVDAPEDAGGPDADGVDVSIAPRREAVEIPTLAPSRAYPVVLGPVAVPVSREEASGRSQPAPEKDDAALPVRRPMLRGDASLLHASQATVAYHLAAFEAAAGRLTAAPSEAEAQRVLIAAHRVRLALESFAPTLPTRAADRLVASLRLLVHDLDEWLDVALAEREGPSVAPALSGRRSHAARAVLQRLQGDRQRAWGDRALRLLARLSEQRVGGALLGDDFPAPPDDFVGDPGDVPAPTRLRHVLGSMLWARYEAVRAFEDELHGDVDADLSYHLTIAVSGLHFVLGLAARASTGPVREVADVLNDAESALADYRRRRRTAELVAGAGETAPAPDPDTVRLTWQTLAASTFRSRLAAVAASI